MLFDALMRGESGMLRETQNLEIIFLLFLERDNTKKMGVLLDWIIILSIFLVFNIFV